jgi:hypothetical protein
MKLNFSKLLLVVCLLAALIAGIAAAGGGQGPLYTTGGPAPGQIPLFVTPNLIGPSNLSFDASGNLQIKAIEQPPGAPIVALAGAGAGNCTNGTHTFAVIFTTASGTSLAGATSGVTVANNAANGQITVSSIPLGTDPYVTGRKVYMSQAGGTTLFLLSNGTIADNTTTSITANDSDATLGAAALAPTTATAIDTRATISNGGIITQTGPMGSAAPVTLVFGAAPATNAGLGNVFIITATSNTAITFAAPTSPTTGQLLTYVIRNTSGGSMGSVSFNAVFKTASGFTTPATANSRTITFLYNGANWVELYRGAADVAN